MKVSNALISVFDKDRVAKFARGLSELGVDIVSTDGTAEFLEDKDIDVKRISELTDYGKMLGGRVKTLHPKIFAGILADRKEDSHMRQLEEKSIRPIDLVVVNFYPFQDFFEDGDNIEDVIEMIDIGGPALVRAASKNFENVAVVTDPASYDDVLIELEERNLELSKKTRLRMAVKGFSLTSGYDKYIQTILSRIN